MKKNIAFAVAAALVSSAAFAAGPSGFGVGSLDVLNSISGTVNSGTSGSSSSQSFNSQTATISNVTSGQAATDLSRMNASTVGTITTEGRAMAMNQSTGTGFGMALSQGSARAENIGETLIQGITSGGGFAQTSGANAVTAFTNQGGENVTRTTAGFNVGLEYVNQATVTPIEAGSSIGRSVTISDTKSGYATVTTNTWNGAELGISGLTRAAGTNTATGTGSYGASANGSGLMINAPTFNIPSIGIPMTPVGF